MINTSPEADNNQNKPVDIDIVMMRTQQHRINLKRLGLGLHIGDPRCAWYSGNNTLKCAIAPKTYCDECTHFESLNSDSWGINA